MNYLKIYNNLVAKAKSRLPVKGYSEKHHVIPKCMGGGNSTDNLVEFLAEEHYLAHLLLAKIYPEISGLVYAVHIMSTSKKLEYINNKSYAWCRKLHAQEVSKRHSRKIISEETLEKMRLSKIGTTHTQESKLKIAENSRDMWKNMSDEKRQEYADRTRLINLGKTFSEETRQKISVARTGTKASEETKAKLSAAKKGVPKSEAHKLAMSQAQMGHVISEETKRKIGEKSKGRKWSAETKAKTLATRAANHLKKKQLKCTA